MVTEVGDSERQAFLRDKAIKEAKTIHVGPDTLSIYIRRIISKVKPGNMVLDVGCGTAHIIGELAKRTNNVFYVGLDISSAMAKIARRNNKENMEIGIMRGDGLNLPFKDESFQVVINRLADFSLNEVYRVLKNGGVFLRFGLGPEGSKEILSIFPDRYDEGAFFFPKNPRRWKKEVAEEIQASGFSEMRLNDYKGRSYYLSVESLVNLIEMVPLVKDFDRRKDIDKLERFSKEYGTKRGIPITDHFYILGGTKPQRP
jgi:SAM-dependent methyltransferase